MIMSTSFAFDYSGKLIFRIIVDGDDIRVCPHLSL